MPGLLLCSDLHSDRTVDTHFAIKQIVDLAIEKRVEGVVAAGDNTDKQTQRSDPIVAFFRQLDRLQKAEIPFYYLQGQHDFDTPPWLSGHRWAQHLHKQVITIGDDTFYGLDFQPFGKLQEELEEIPERCNFLIAHQGWDEWLGFDNAPQGSFAQIPGHVDYVYSGDLHQLKDERNKNRVGNKIRTWSTGATTQRKADEPSEHYVAIYHKGKFTPHKLKSRVFVDASVMIRQEDVEDFITGFEGTLAKAMQRAAGAEYPQEMLKPRFRVTYAADLGDVVRRIDKIVADRATVLYREIPPEAKKETMKLSKAAKGLAVTPLSVLPDEVDKEEDPATFELVSRLLQASDYEAEFAAWRMEMMGEA